MDRKNLPNLELKNFSYFLLSFLVCLIAVGLVSSLPSIASGPAEFILGWDANSEVDLDGYEIYVRQETAGTTYTFLAEVYLDELEDPDNPKVTISELYDGLQSDLITPVVRMAELANNSTYHFALTAFDTQGKTSDFSEELCVEVIGTAVFECGSTDNSNGDNSSPDNDDSDSSNNSDSSDNSDGSDTIDSGDSSGDDSGVSAENSSNGGGGGCFIVALSF